MVQIEGFTEGPPRFVAIANLADAQEYVIAARVLYDSQNPRISSPQYFLISQAIELLLKAYIVARGNSVDAVRGPKIQHRLNGLLAKAERLGFDLCTPEARMLIGILHPLHESHYFRYRLITQAEWPSAREGVQTLERFASAISPLIASAINAGGRKIGVS